MAGCGFLESEVFRLKYLMDMPETKPGALAMQSKCSTTTEHQINFQNIPV